MPYCAPSSRGPEYNPHRGTGRPGQGSEGYLDIKGESAKFGASLSQTGLQAYLLSDSHMARSTIWKGQLDAYLYGKVSWTSW